MRQDYIRSLNAYLLGSDSLLNLRKRLIVASVCAVCSACSERLLPPAYDGACVPQRTAELDHDRQALADASNSFESRIESRVQITILRHILLALPALTGASTTLHAVFVRLTRQTDADRRFAMRMVARACLPGSDPDVVRDAHALAAKLGPTATNTADPIQYEPCPACQAPIPFLSAATAECPHGHVWGALAV